MIDYIEIRQNYVATVVVTQLFIMQAACTKLFTNIQWNSLSPATTASDFFFKLYETITQITI